MRLAITPGEPAGIGPDLLVRLAQSARNYELVGVCDPQLMRDRAATLGLPLELIEYDPAVGPGPTPPGVLHIQPIFLRTPAVPGKLDARNAQYVLESLRWAISRCQNGEFAALVTGPVHKAIINDAGIAFSGHTEFLAEQTGTRRVVMMLSSPQMRVALATTHLALRDVADAITPALIEETIRIVCADLQRLYGIVAPHLLVAGLNPHAGEGGHLGREELEIIAPALEKLRREGYDVVGPLPADTIFTPHLLKQADAVVVMYHDQGLPVLKSHGFGVTVNVTLGLPIIRTSVDHGTALDLAGTDRADASSLDAAIACAFKLAGHVAAGGKLRRPSS